MHGGEYSPHNLVCESPGRISIEPLNIEIQQVLTRLSSSRPSRHTDQNSMEEKQHHDNIDNQDKSKQSNVFENVVINDNDDED